MTTLTKLQAQVESFMYLVDFQAEERMAYDDQRGVSLTNTGKLMLSGVMQDGRNLANVFTDEFTHISGLSRRTMLALRRKGVIKDVHGIWCLAHKDNAIDTQGEQA